MKATAVARANIALIKYWGKRDDGLNLPAVGSISLTLDGLRTVTSVEWDASQTDDQLILNGQPAPRKETERVSAFLQLIRRLAAWSFHAKVESSNNFPTGAGLASSASAFAALALAASAAANLELTPTELSVLARRGSGSAARSIFGGFVEMAVGARPDGSDAFAHQIAPESFWDVRLLVAVTSREAKKTGSTEGMRRSAGTSPYFSAWVKSQPQDLHEMRQAIQARDLQKAGELMEYNCLKMHALTFSSRPPFSYWNSTTIELMRTVQELRAKGTPAYFTIDAGPQVKVLCRPKESAKIKAGLESLPGVREVLVARPGPGAHLVEATG